MKVLTNDGLAVFQVASVPSMLCCCQNVRDTVLPNGLAGL